MTSTTPTGAPTGTVHAPRGVLVDLGPVAQLRAGRLARRLPQLYVGLFLYGVSLALMVRGALGLAPWDVLHSGFIRHVPMTLGQAVVLFSFVVLVLWIPLREMPGLGTISNAIVVGLSADATLAVLDRPEAMAGRLGLMVGGVLLWGLASALYIGAQLGRGPRGRPDDRSVAAHRALAAALPHRPRGGRGRHRPAARWRPGRRDRGLRAGRWARLPGLMLPWFTVDAMGPDAD